MAPRLAYRHLVWDRRLTRRRSVQIAGSGIAAAAFLAACKGGEKKTTQTSSGTAPGAVATNLIPPGLEQDHPLIAQYHWSKLPLSTKTPKRGGRLHMQMFDPGTWDPTDPSAQVTVSQYTGYWANRVLRPDTSLASAMSGKNNLYQNVVTPDLAASYEQADPTKLIFHIRDNVKFHDIKPVDGRKLTAQDIKFTFDFYRQPSATGTVSIFRDVKSVEAPDDKTIVITTNKPVAYLVNDLSSPLTPIVPKEAVEGDAKAKFSRQPIGTGPFMVKEYVPHSKIKMDRNPNYFLSDRPYLDGVDHAWLQDPASVLAAFRTKQIDFAVLTGQDQLQQLLQTDKDIVVHVNQQNTGGLQFHVGWDLSHAPFNDVRVRRALTLAVDREAMGKSIYKVGHLALAFPTDWTSWPYAPAASQYGQWYKYDPAQAKQLLEAAGATNLKTKLRGRADPTGNDIAALLLEFWKKAGVTVDYEPMEDTAFFKAYFAKDIPGLTIEHLTTAGFDLDDFSYRLMRTGEPSNLFKIADPELDSLLDKQQATFDRPERQKAGDAIIKRDLDQVYRSWNICWYFTEVKRPQLQNLVAADLYWWGQFWGSTQMADNWLDK